MDVVAATIPRATEKQHRIGTDSLNSSVQFKDKMLREIAFQSLLLSLKRFEILLKPCLKISNI